MDIILDNIFEIAIVLIFLLILYRGFCWKPKVKIVKAPTTKQIRRQKKRARQRRKFSRWFKVPYVVYRGEIKYPSTAALPQIKFAK